MRQAVKKRPMYAAFVLAAELVLACATTQSSDAPPRDIPKIVVSVYGPVGSPANNTSFVLYASGRILSSFARAAEGAPVIELWLNESEKAKFLKSLILTAK